MVYPALDFLINVNRGEVPAVSGENVIVGNGSVAADSGMSAVRLGAESVALMCLEERDGMPADRWEIQDALAEGVLVENVRNWKNYGRR